MTGFVQKMQKGKVRIRRRIWKRGHYQMCDGIMKWLPGRYVEVEDGFPKFDFGEK